MGDINDTGPWAAWAGSAGIGLAVGLALLYLVLRRTAWSPGRGDPVQAVRTHAMVTALIALFASGTAGLNQLVTADEYEVFGQGAFPVTTETGDGVVRQIISTPLPALSPVEGLGAVLGPVLGLILVYGVAQYTWPRPSGVVRTARLTDRRPADLLPRALTTVTALIAAAALGVVALAWSAPGVEARQVEEFWGGTGPEEAHGSTLWSTAGVRAGAEVAPWLLAALVLTVLGVLVVLRTVARRPVLHGLHPTDDDLVRRIAVHRALRTAAAMAVGIGMTGYSLYAGTHPTPEGVQWPTVTALLVLFVLLFWRPPHVSELGSHTATGPQGHDAGPASLAVPGSARAALRLRRDGAALAWISLAPVALVVVAFVLLPAATDTDDAPWRPLLVAALPVIVALAVLGLAELGVRRGHCPARAPATQGTASRWSALALGLAVALAAVWCGLSLTTPEPQTALAVALAVTTAVIALSALGLARMALHRAPLARATAEQDAALRTGGADRMLAVGAAGVLTVTGAALLLGVQVWSMFLASAVLDLRIDEVVAR